nr:60S ribosomal protein L10-like [Vulpes vulpes]
MASGQQPATIGPAAQEELKPANKCMTKLGEEHGPNAHPDVNYHLLTTQSVLGTRNRKKDRCPQGTHCPDHEVVGGLTSCYLQSRLQTGMRGAFGKLQGTVARVHIGQVIMPIRTKLQNKEHVIEALRRAKFKFPGHQKIHISKKRGFTKFNVDEFEDMVAEKRLIPDGWGIKYIPNRGPLDKWKALHS